MSHFKDLTRWNRAGLDRFDYVDANAASILEILRQYMVKEYTDPLSGELQWRDLEIELDNIAVAGETHTEKNRRLLEQYNGETRDYAWEFLRTFSRSVHVTLAHVNAYANEGYIGTATQWDNIRRLVNMLDYHPAPAASAYTYIALQIKAGQQGKVVTGWQIKNAPEDGSAPLIFETLTDIDAYSELNILHAHDWQFNEERVDTYQDNILQEKITLLKTVVDEDVLSSGSRGICLIENKSGTIVESYPVKIVRTDRHELHISGLPDSSDYALYQLKLLFNPEFRAIPRLHGPSVVQLQQSFNYSPGSIIGWQDGAWHLGVVQSVVDDRIILDGGIVPPDGSDLYLMFTARRQTVTFNTTDDEGDYLILPQAAYRKEGKAWFRGASGFSLINSFDINTEKNLEKVSDTYSQVTAAYYLDIHTGPAAHVTEESSTIHSSALRLEFAGRAKGLNSGQWLLCRTDNNYYTLQIKQIEQYKNYYFIDFSVPAGGFTLSEPVVEVSGLFADTFRADDFNRSQQIITGSDIALQVLPDSLKRGRKIQIISASLAHEAVITDLKRTATPPLMTIEPPLPQADAPVNAGKDYVSGLCRIFANVVLVGHGEAKPEKVLGSGNATQVRQTFILETKDVSFVADPEMNSGVRADITIRIDGRVWQQKASLNYSGPADPHYVVRMTEDGFLKIIFGDGEKARRLPSGKNNIRIRYRVGSGSRGNLPANSLVKVVKPHNLLSGHYQPIAATSGNGVESGSSLKQTAAASLMTFERAVSLRDFVNLANNYSSVWQASAIRRNVRYSRNEHIDIVIVPAGGGVAADALKNQLQLYLVNAALPGVEVNIINHQPIELYLDISIRIRYEEYDYEEVKLTVINALLTAFSLSVRELGQALYRSDIYKVVEQVKGVENSDCVILSRTVNEPHNPPLSNRRQVVYGNTSDTDRQIIRSIRPTMGQLIVMSQETSVSIRSEAFTTEIN